MTVKIDLDEKLLAEVDALIVDEGMNRSNFIEKAVREALRKRAIEEKERRHREGYEKFPVQPDEFEIEDEQMEEFWKQV